jgi:polyisoprenoid-binding protein YceI
MQKLALGILSLSLFLAASEDPAASKPKATLSNSANAPSNSQLSANDSATAQAKGTRLAVSPDNSKVEFTGSKVTGKHEGGFKRFDGFIDLVNDKVENSKVSVDIEMNSVFTDTDAVTKHLQTGDFFEVDKYPKSTFESTQIVPDADKGAGNYMVTGDLEMHGIKKAITFPAQINIDPEQVSVNSEFAINRKDFGIVYAGKADDLIRDNVVIHLDLKAPRKK